ncbi:hypothetical protein B7463_g11250, partial [Scytalidium lignicola]
MPTLTPDELFIAAGGENSGQDPFYAQAILVTSALRWWNNALGSFNDQLIAYEEMLLVEDGTSNDTLPLLNSETNRTLHCMAAQLYRYGSELALLLVDNAQVANDRLLIQNGKVIPAVLQATQLEAELSRHTATQSQQVTEEMKKILEATQVETKMSRRAALQSQKLSEQMQKDGVAMKTIALLTTFFLPGTSFAAILSMPFFADTHWMQEMNRLWVWIVLTVPATTLCFIYYMIWTRNESRQIKKTAKDEEELVAMSRSPSAVRTEGTKTR